MNSISHKWISCSFYYPRTYELCPALKPTVSRCESVHGSFGLVATWENQNKCKVINWIKDNTEQIKSYY